MDNDLKEYMLYEEEYRHFLKNYPDYTGHSSVSIVKKKNKHILL